MYRHRRHFQLASHGPLVELLDPLQLVLEAQLACLDGSRCQSVKHEGIVGVRAVRDVDDPALVRARLCSMHGARSYPERPVAANRHPQVSRLK